MVIGLLVRVDVETPRTDALGARRACWPDQGGPARARETDQFRRWRCTRKVGGPRPATGTALTSSELDAAHAHAVLAGIETNAGGGRRPPP
jgi:hypothetical protein